MHIYLVGDSTLDNARYTDGGPDVVAQLSALLMPSDRATLLAVDGAIIAMVEQQLEELRRRKAGDDPKDCPTHVVLSVGGNDLLGQLGILELGASSVAEALLLVAESAARFGEAYRTLLDEVLTLRLPVVTATVYNGAFTDPAEAEVVRTALRIYDHEIIDAGLDRGLPVLDLRRICSEPEDYWDPIEPSCRGGEKIARAILGAIRAPRYDVGGRVMTLQGTGGLMG